ncbi:MAG: BMC domain-containing protein [Firmicutes bacterium]|nr:BMC domain-containing protein [Bacillota bacterium]MDD7015647.1 BMC domain-containing protein [Bacillota bacterium]
MTERMDRDSVLHKIYGRAIERAKAGSGQIRSVQVTTPGKEITLAHVIGSPEQEVYDNLALEIGFHEGFKHHGAMGIINITPPESAIIAADISVKSGDIDVGFMDRFSGTLIITGSRADVDQAMRDNLDYFEKSLHYRVCSISNK